MSFVKKAHKKKPKDERYEPVSDLTSLRKSQRRPKTPKTTKLVNQTQAGKGQEVEQISDSDKGGKKGQGLTTTLEADLIHVKVDENEQQAHIHPCPMCGRRPSASEIKAGKCATCGLALIKKHHVEWNRKRWFWIIVVSLIVLVLIFTLIFLIYFGATKKGRTLVYNKAGYRLPPDNTSVECKVYDVKNWAKWGNCSSSCGAGLEEKDRKVASEGNYCPPIEYHQLCQSAPCCPDKWTGYNRLGLSCYRYFENETTFAGAVEKCEKEESVLATPDNDAEWKLMREKYLKEKNIWLGIEIKTKFDTKALYYLISLFTVPNNGTVLYSRWASHEPQQDAEQKIKCVYMNHTTGLWVSTVDCGLDGITQNTPKYPFLCNKPTTRSNFIAT